MIPNREQIIKFGQDLLALSRMSYLPTVWSNCLAGFLLSGGGSAGRWIALFLGCTLIYVGGMCLHDACDADFDLSASRPRPIPKQVVPERTVWLISLYCFIGAFLCLSFLGIKPMSIASVLLFVLVLFFGLHKAFVFTPALQGGIRLLLYLLGASCATDGVSGLAIWCGLAMGVYEAFASIYETRPKEQTRLPVWPCFFLVTPLVLAFYINGPGYRIAASLYAILLCIWLWVALRKAWTPTFYRPQQIAADLTASLVLVDMLATCPGAPARALIFLILFGLVIILQQSPRTRGY
jgi:4-hydroxybenzoate polyprenyltransferase